MIRDAPLVVRQRSIISPPALAKRELLALRTGRATLEQEAVGESIPDLDRTHRRHSGRRHSKAQRQTVDRLAESFGSPPPPCRDAAHLEVGADRWARSTNSVTASEVTPPSSVSGDTVTATPSAGVPSASREVAADPEPGARVRVHRRRRGGQTCSRFDDDGKRLAIVSMSGTSPCGVIPNTVASVAGRAADHRRRRGRSLIQTPSGNSPASSAPTSRANRVLPTPPRPVSVTSRLVRTSSATSATSASPHPARLPLPGQVAHEVVDDEEAQGNWDRSPSATTWNTAIRRADRATRAHPAVAGSRGHAAGPRSCRTRGSGLRGRAPSAEQLVHLAPHVVPIAMDRVPHVPAHPDSEHGGVVGAQLLLGLDRRAPRRHGRGRGERSAKTVAAGGEHVHRRGVRWLPGEWCRGPASHAVAISAASSRVESWMSVNRNVTVPRGDSRACPNRNPRHTWSPDVGVEKHPGG